MKIEKILVYPVKSLRPVELTTAKATRQGFSLDRRFMLVKMLPDGSVKNMHVTKFTELVCFQPSLSLANEDDVEHVDAVTLTFTNPDTKQQSTLDFPARPVTDGLDLVEVTMHQSTTRGYDMGSECNDWFTECLGYDVKLLYLGDNLREVLMTTRVANPISKSLTSWLPAAFASQTKDKITFADCAAYLIVSRKSLGDVSRRLPDGETMDITKFRPNIVVEGAEEAWEEDYWGAISTGSAKFDLVQNCARCASINVDYDTGKPGLGESGSILKKLQSDRRVDKGAKYSPIFGRYAFLSPGIHEVDVNVGDEVTVVKRNAERTHFDWPGLSTA